ncbi:hypothetical protein ABID56_001090 [Alkalibacillus flavidus]|uniref:NERD domain-containing protein n=1 Tax=Alkalibacillus flavidus TaxID=546021 RepID=A0ABV2KTT5_9BACI
MTTILHDQSPDLKMLNVLMPRLERSAPFYKELKEWHTIECAGYEGEQSLYYYINQLKGQFFHLHGLYFQTRRSACQIDHLLVLPEFILILETKHFKGELHYNVETGVLEQTTPHRTVRRADPIAQALVQKEKLNHLLQSTSYPTPPLHHLVVFTHDEVIPTIEGHEPNMIVKERLLQRVGELMKHYSDGPDQTDYLEQLAQFIASNHTSRESKIIEDHPDIVAYLKSGVWCTGCGEHFMDRIFNNWECPICKHRDRSAHIQTLKECRMIYGNEVSCQLVANFLRIPPHLARQLLKRQAKQIGEKRGTKYILV